MKGKKLEIFVGSVLTAPVTNVSYKVEKVVRNGFGEWTYETVVMHTGKKQTLFESMIRAWSVDNSGVQK